MVLQEEMLKTLVNTFIFTVCYWLISVSSRLLISISSSSVLVKYSVISTLLHRTQGYNCFLLRNVDLERDGMQQYSEFP